MQLLEFTNYKRNSIKDTFGAPEYSYVFVRNAFQPVLERVGNCVEVTDPATADTLFEAAQARGEDCVLLTFCPPNTTPLEQSCPTLPVFAWEYDTLPSEFWTEDPRENWIYVLARTGMAITHCTFSSNVVREALGPDFPVWTIPAPVFDKFARVKRPTMGWRETFTLHVEGGLGVSAGEVDLSLFKPGRAKTEGLQALRLLGLAARSQESPQRFELEGVVYTAVLNPNDGRKNWELLLSGFVWAFRDEPTAILIVKLTRFDLEGGLVPVLQHMSTLGPFSCKVILIDGLLTDEAYSRLVDATSYAVNTAYGEGQCLPLMEYMSSGRPAVAAAHSAMADYMSSDNAFTVAYEPRPTHWPHDERLAVRCNHNLVSFADLVRQYRESYRVARDDPERYARMSAAAVESLRAFCSEAVVEARLRDVVRHVQALPKTQKAGARPSD